jgi:hypothetical protein
MESFCRQTIPIIPRKWPRFRIAALVLAAAASMSLTHSPRAFGEPSDQALGEDSSRAFSMRSSAFPSRKPDLRF